MTNSKWVGFPESPRWDWGWKQTDLQEGPMQEKKKKKNLERLWKLIHPFHLCCERKEETAELLRE